MFRGSLAFVCMGVLLFAQSVSAATLYFDPPQKTLGRGDAEIFKVRLDTDEAAEECINAVSGVIQFSGPISPVDVSTGESILNIWLESPRVHADKKQVTFAGGIPNGYCGRIAGDPNLTNVLFEIVARADVDEGSVEVATVAFTSETTAYLNDGFGTLASVQLLPSTLTILGAANAVVADPWTEQVGADTVPPQEFSIQLAKDTRAFSGKYFITFSTTDKQSGIDHYEVMEEPLKQAGSFLWGGANAPWLEATSPYVLADQSLNSTIRVRAIDKAGNEYVATLLPDEDIRSLSTGQLVVYLLYGTLLIGFVVLFVTFLRSRFSMTSHRSSIVNSEEHTSDEYGDVGTD